MIYSSSSSSISFSVPGVPVAKGRPRFTKSGHTYTPSPTVDYERLVQNCALANNGLVLTTSPLVMMLYVYFPVPKSWSKSRRELALSGSVYPVCKPDLDNVVKSVSDALNGICYWDDSAIVDLIVSKRYSLYPRVDVVISCLGGDCVHK